MRTLTVTSTVFADGGTLPSRYTCAGAGESPPIAWSGVPDDAASLALVVTDPDAPRGTFLHWLVYDIPPGDGGAPAGAPPAGAREGENTGRRVGWYPPCPPSGTHRYVFTVTALDTTVRGGSSRHILDVVTRHAIATGSITGHVSAG